MIRFSENFAYMLNEWPQKRCHDDNTNVIFMTLFLLMNKTVLEAYKFNSLTILTQETYPKATKRYWKNTLNTAIPKLLWYCSLFVVKTSRSFSLVVKSNNIVFQENKGDNKDGRRTPKSKNLWQRRQNISPANIQ